MKNTILQLAALLILLGPTGMHATVITGAGTGFLTSPGTTIDFGDFGSTGYTDGTVITTQFAGVTFGSNGDSWTYRTASIDPPEIVGGHLIRSTTTQAITEFKLLFETNVFEAMFNFKAFSSTEHEWIMSSWLNGTQVETVTFVTPDSSSGYYYGFDNSLFDEIRLENQKANAGFEFDNLQYSSVPEPSALALLSLGLFGLGFNRRKRL